MSILREIAQSRTTPSPTELVHAFDEIEARLLTLEKKKAKTKKKRTCEDAGITLSLVNDACKDVPLPGMPDLAECLQWIANNLGQLRAENQKIAALEKALDVIQSLRDVDVKEDAAYAKDAELGRLVRAMKQGQILTRCGDTGWQSALGYNHIRESVSFHSPEEALRSAMLKPVPDYVRPDLEREAQRTHSDDGYPMNGIKLHDSYQRALEAEVEK